MLYNSLPLCLLAAVQLAQAHTWIEQMMVVSSNGTMVGTPGFARGNVLRSSPSFSDPTMVNLLPPDGREINDILPTDLMCKSSQTSQSQTDGSPRLQAAPGDAVALRYQENGHVTLPDNQPGKPGNRGTVFVYGTTQPSPDDAFLAIHRVWNADGTGGDGRGKLLSTQNFDDGQCYQVNGGTISQQRQKQFPHTANQLMGGDVWCQQDVAIPSDASSGKAYTLYWVWDWPTMPGTAGFPDGKQEIYTTCMDVDISGSAQSESVSFSQGQDLNNAAISSEMADLSNPTAVTGSSIAFSASATGPASGAASTASAGVESTTNTDPGFLSVHTTSTGGPGLETSANPFTTVPTDFSATSGPTVTTAQPAATSAPAQPDVTSTSDQPQQSSAATSSTESASSQGAHGHGGNSFGGFSTTSAAAADGTAISVPGQQMTTFTQFDSVFETVFHTVYQTRFTKRNIPMTEAAAIAIPSSSESATAISACSTAEAVYRLRARLPFFPF